MSYYPLATTNSLLKSFMSDPFESFFSGSSNRPTHLMTTDIRETEKDYQLDIDLPGFKKDEIAVELADGTLSICACKGQSHEEEKPGQYIRRERSFGECRRSFYVGEGIEPKDVCAKYEDGILKLCFPKAPEKKEPEDRKVAIQ